MKLTIPYYLHKAGAGFPSPATDYIEEDIDLLQEKESQRLLYANNKGLLVSCSCFVLFYRLVIQYTQEVVF